MSASFLQFIIIRDNDFYKSELRFITPKFPFPLYTFAIDENDNKTVISFVIN